MSRPATAAWERCQMSALSRTGSAAKPSAYNCTTAASSTRSRRYFRSAPAWAGACCVPGTAAATVSVFPLSAPPPHEARVVAATASVRRRRYRMEIAYLTGRRAAGVLPAGSDPVIISAVGACLGLPPAATACRPPPDMHYLLIYDVVSDYAARRVPLRAAHIQHARAAV